MHFVFISCILEDISISLLNDILRQIRQREIKYLRQNIELKTSRSVIDESKNKFVSDLWVTRNHNQKTQFRY